MLDSPLQIARRARALFESGFVILDLETTSLADDPQVSIVEIGILNHHGEILLETRVKPTRDITPGAMAVHHITDADVAEAPPFEKVYPQLAEQLSGQVAAVYNVNFDREVLAKVCRRAGLALPQPTEWFCAMRTYASLRSSQRWFRLEAACLYERIPVQSAHSAVGDCRLTLALLRKMADRAS